MAEITNHPNNNTLASFDAVSNRGFHGSTAGATHWNRDPIIGLPGVAQHFLHLVHQFEVEGIQMAQGRPGKGLKHRGMGVRGPWAEQQPLRGGDRLKPQAVDLAHGLKDRGERRKGHAPQESNEEDYAGRCLASVGPTKEAAKMLEPGLRLSSTAGDTDFG